MTDEAAAAMAARGNGGPSALPGLREAETRASGMTRESLTIETLVHAWTRGLRAVLVPMYLCLAIALLSTVASVTLTQRWFIGLFIALAFVLAIYFMLKAISYTQRLSASWRDELIAPIQRLMQTVSLIASQKLDLLPEERRHSFTSDSQQKLLELARDILEHQRFIDRVVDNMFEMMFLLNPDGIITKANKSACETTRYQPSELVGQHLRKLFPHSGTLVDYYLELEIQFTTVGSVRDLEIHIETSEGEVLPFSVNGVKIESSSGDLLGYTLIFKNMAETYRLINQLNKSNFDLNKANTDLAKRYDEIKKEIEEKEGERKVFEIELATSQLVQKTFLPQKPPSHDIVDVAGASVPAAFCGGDWWNTISVGDKFYIFIGDVTGHGTASAMVTAAISGYFVSLTRQLEVAHEASVANPAAGIQLPDVAEILAGFDSVLSTMATDGIPSYNMTFFACVLDFKKKTLRFANAGHNFPLLLRPDLKMSPLVAAGHRLGNAAKEPFETLEVPIEKDDLIFFYTDGLIENKNRKDEQFGKRRLRKFIESHAAKTSQEFVDALLKESLHFYGANKELEDDVTFVAVRLKDF